jgi:hypothetical protein
MLVLVHLLNLLMTAKINQTYNTHYTPITSSDEVVLRQKTQQGVFFEAKCVIPLAFCFYFAKEYF